jgi:hypothetical protein
LVRHGVLVAYRRYGGASLDFPLFAGDIADSAVAQLRVPSERPERPSRLRVGVVVTPPALGSGGHTTMFRMVEELERRGHRCVLYFYDRHHGDLGRHRAVIREGWPWLHAEVAALPDRGQPVDALVATGWATAHAVAARPDLIARRLYFVQDYEPFFFAHGFEYALAEDSYRFGFRTIALGHMVAQRLAEELGVKADVVEFSCDTEVYRPPTTPGPPRAGVVWYARPGASRRGYALCVLALEEFHARHPDQPIHVYGESPVGLPFPVVQHGRLTPRQRNALYGQVVAGLAMSFTNISLVAEEMLASGVVPIVNDSADARADLPHGGAVWARPTPRGVAEALTAVLGHSDTVGRAADAAAAVRRDAWRDTAARTADLVEDEVFGPG